MSEIKEHTANRLFIDEFTIEFSVKKKFSLNDIILFYKQRNIHIEKFDTIQGYQAYSIRSFMPIKNIMDTRHTSPELYFNDCIAGIDWAIVNFSYEYMARFWQHLVRIGRSNPIRQF